MANGDKAMVEVEVKSSAASKINWFAGGGALIMFIIAAVRYTGVDLPDIPPDVQKFLGEAVSALLFLLIGIMRTWYTTTITNASAKKLQ